MLGAFSFFACSDVQNPPDKRVPCYLAGPGLKALEASQHFIGLYDNEPREPSAYEIREPFEKN